MFSSSSFKQLMTISFLSINDYLLALLIRYDKMETYNFSSGNRGKSGLLFKTLFFQKTQKASPVFVYLNAAGKQQKTIVPILQANTFMVFLKTTGTLVGNKTIFF